VQDSLRLTEDEIAFLAQIEEISALTTEERRRLSALIPKIVNTARVVDDLMKKFQMLRQSAVETTIDLQEKVYCSKFDLAAALEIIALRGDDAAREWLRLNHPGQPMPDRPSCRDLIKTLIEQYEGGEVSLDETVEQIMTISCPIDINAYIAEIQRDREELYALGAAIDSFFTQVSEWEYRTSGYKQLLFQDEALRFAAERLRERAMKARRLIYGP